MTAAANILVADEEVQRPRFVVGIDLGTTNSAMCLVDTEATSWQIETFSIPQVVAAGQVESLQTLPSFHYESLPDEIASGATRLPWLKDAPASVVGVYARDHGRTIPGRMIESAKSWLCHSGVDRKAALLPWHGAADVKRLSPVEASSRYLRHLRDAWNVSHPEHLLEQQDVVLTIPASFDEVARELTVAAARAAGLPRVVLLEEPQAAFYSWVDAHRDEWEQHVSPGQKILVCDIGGGTTDFSLIHVRSGEGGRLQFHRVAVGDHLLLGGDNLDLALAHFVEQKLGNGKKLEARQWTTLEATTVPLALSRGTIAADKLRGAFETHSPHGKAEWLWAMARGFTDDDLTNGAAAGLVKSLDDGELVVRRYAFKCLTDIARSSETDTLRYRPDWMLESRREGVQWWKGQLEKGAIRHAAESGGATGP